MSSRDIDRGALWFSEISERLRDTGTGIVCITAENKNRPWLLFEAGALAKGISSNRVCTFLIDLKPEDIKDPLAQFNHTTPDIESMRGLIETLNSRLPEGERLEKEDLDASFQTYWPKFEREFAQCIATHPQAQTPPPRSEYDILNEILDNTRTLRRQLADAEAAYRSISGRPPPIKTEELAEDLLKRGYSSRAVLEELTRLGMRSDAAFEAIMADTLKRMLTKEGESTAGEKDGQ